eukprot:4390431-Pyramimonas_sp.AAC.2
MCKANRRTSLGLAMQCTKGRVAEVALWGRQLSPAEVSQVRAGPSEVLTTNKQKCFTGINWKIVSTYKPNQCSLNHHRVWGAAAAIVNQIAYSSISVNAAFGALAYFRLEEGSGAL